MMKLLSQILAVINSFLKLKIKNVEKDIKKQEDLKRDTKSLEQQKEESSNAVFNGDIDMINKIINSCLVITLTLSLCGCIHEKIIYVQSDREVKRVVYDNIQGYFVPDIVMKELLEYKIEAKYYKEAYESIKHKESN